MDNTILPTKNNRNILITSALPYVNNVPHLGNIIGSVLSADVYARFCRNRGYQTLFIGGTDEYGTATETAAIKEQLTPREICDKYHKIHSDIYQWFNISFDKFGRTTTDKQTEIVQEIFTNCYNRNLVTESEIEQLYCENCKKFLADRFVEGICPLCKHADARGDQCDFCQHLYNAIDLIDPICKQPNCGSKPIIKKTNHLFLDLPNLQPQLINWYTHCNRDNWSNQSISITNSWLNNSLTQRCITRDLSWGVAVPKIAGPKYESKVFYVWFDALIGYISITASYTDKWELWWKSQNQNQNQNQNQTLNQPQYNVELYQFMGKDNVPFHSIIFPATLIASNDNPNYWTLPNAINCTSYLTYEGSKFSKSKNVGIFGTQILDLGIPSYVWRYYLLTIRPTDSDSDFQWTEFIAKNNNELLAIFGNFVNRLLKFCEKNYQSTVPYPKTDKSNVLASENIDDQQDILSWEKLIADYINLMEKREFKSGLSIVMKLASCGNKFWQKNKPWNLFKTSVERCNLVTNIALNLLNVLATLCEPFMPSLSETILNQLNTQIILLDTSTQNKLFNQFSLKSGHQMNKPYPIVQEIKESRLEDFYQMFGYPNKN